jgi:hypothetical protein
MTIAPLTCCEWTLHLRRFSTLNDLLLAHSPYPTTMRDVFGPDAYRFCKLISDTIKTAVAIGCGSGAGGMRFYSALVVPSTTGRWMVANAARFPVTCGITRLAAGRFCCGGPRAQLAFGLG